MKTYTTTRANLKPIVDFKKPFDMMAVDVLELSRTNSNNKYVVVFSDYLTRWVEAFPMKDMLAETIAKIFVNEILTRHSAPKKLLSDQGKNFLSNIIKEICNYFNIHKVQTTPYNPKCDGLVERFNKTLCQMLAAYSNSNQTNWDVYLPLVLFAYRTSQQTTTGESPFALLYGREPNLSS
jgi:transposase InsO family protein